MKRCELCCCWRLRAASVNKRKGCCGSTPTATATVRFFSRLPFGCNAYSSRTMQRRAVERATLKGTLLRHQPSCCIAASISCACHRQPFTATALVRLKRTSGGGATPTEPHTPVYGFIRFAGVRADSDKARQNMKRGVDPGKVSFALCCTSLRPGERGSSCGGRATENE
jgi:hypothetical protein